MALGGVILAFATGDPRVEVFAPQGWWYLLGAALATVGLVWHLRTEERPLVPRGAFRRTPAWGALLVSLFVGAALIAALIDIPIFARTTVYPDSQLQAALVLVRFLVALPVGAVVGGYLVRALPAGVVAGGGMLLAALGFVLMSQWGLATLSGWSANVSLLVGGLGFGLALAPVNAVVLASTGSEVHGLASAGVVVARMVGMLVGISALTTIGLRRYYSETRDVPPPKVVCGGPSRCDAFDHLLRHAGIAQEHTVFAGAAVCAVIAAALAPGALPGCPYRGATLPCVGDFDDLLAANAAYAEHFERGGFDGLARAGVAIVTCMDSRIVPLEMLGLRYGDAKIFRNPGARVTPQALEALVLGVHLLGVDRILVVPHTRCAMASATEDELHRRISESAGVDASWQRFHVVDDQARDARRRRPAGARPSADPRAREGRRVPLRRRHRPAHPARLRPG